MPLPTRSPIRTHRGLAVLLVLVIATLVALTGALTQLAAHSHRVPTVRDGLTRAVLEEAKAALVAFAADNRQRPGGLPCPDLDGDGEAELSCDAESRRVGLLPWQTLRTGELRDASGAVLWYAVSGSFRNDPDVAINAHSQAQLTIAGAGAPAAALVIAPGAPRAGQSRARLHAAERSAYLEGENARGSNRFEHFTDDARGNDRVVALHARELMDVVEPIVVNRIRREIAPILTERYVQRWGMFPYASPPDSQGSRQAREPLHEGALPGAEAASLVAWDANGVRVREVGDAGRLRGADCSRSFSAEIRCSIDHDGPARIAIEALARHVAFALVEPPSTSPTDFGPEGLGERVIEVARVTAEGDAHLVAYASLPGSATRTRVHLRAPAPIRELTDRRLPVAARHAWFARNQWQRSLAYAVSPGHTAARSADTDCRHGESCLVVRFDSGVTAMPAALALVAASATPTPVAAATPRSLIALCGSGHHACESLR